MKRFNTQEYLENPNRKIITGDGRNVRIISTNGMSGSYPIIALIPEGNKERVWLYTNDGKYIEDTIDDKDLYFVPEKKTGWTNVYKYASGRTHLGGIIYDSKEEAETEGKKYRRYISTIKIEWEE